MQQSLLLGRKHLVDLLEFDIGIMEVKFKT